MNIVADGSTFVKLYLPKDRRWFGFGGEGELIARTDQKIGSVLKTKQSLIINQEIDEKLRRANQSSNPYEKIRLFNSLKTETDVNNYATQRDVQTRNGQQIEELNKQVDRLVQQPQDEEIEAEALFDNRKQLNQRFLEQSNDITNNAVNQLGNNFDVPVDDASEEEELKAAESQFKKRWFEGNGFIREHRSEDGEDDASRLYKGNTQNFQAPAKQPPGGKASIPQQSGEQQRKRGESGQQRMQQQLRQYQMQQKETLENRKQTLDRFDSRRNSSGGEQAELSDRESMPGASFGGGIAGGVGGMMAGGIERAPAAGRGGGMGGFGAYQNTDKDLNAQIAQNLPGGMDAGVNDSGQPHWRTEQEGQMLEARSTGFTSVSGFVFDEASLNNEFDQFELEYISATSDFTFSAQFVSHSLIETMIRVGVGVGSILVLLIGGWILKQARRSKWLVGFVAVCFLPISLFMIVGWVFPILGLVVLIASATWLLKLKFTSKTVQTA